MAQTNELENSYLSATTIAANNSTVKNVLKLGIFLVKLFKQFTLTWNVATLDR